MKQHGKKYRELAASFDRTKLHDVVEATATVKRNATAKFDETVEIHVRLGVDPKKSDQNVRGTVLLPHGTGRTVRVIAFAKGDKRATRKRPARMSSASKISSIASKRASSISTSPLRRRT